MLWRRPVNCTIQAKKRLMRWELTGQYWYLIYLITYISMNKVNPFYRIHILICFSLSSSVLTLACACEGAGAHQPARHLTLPWQAGDPPHQYVAQRLTRCGDAQGFSLHLSDYACERHRWIDINDNMMQSPSRMFGNATRHVSSNAADYHLLNAIILSHSGLGFTLIVTHAIFSA